MKTLIIVPAFNEARNLPHVIASLREAAPECHICVVDDGSTDDTSRVAGRLGVTVLRSPLNLGIGGAVQLGYLWAYTHDYDAAVQIDGDGQHDPRYLPQVLPLLGDGRADVVIGSRFLETGGFRSTALRRMGIRYLSWMLRLRCGARATDPTSGYRAAGRRAIALFARSYPSDYPEPEAIALAVRHGLRVQDFPMQMKPRQHGESSINWWKTGYYLVKVSLALLLLPASERNWAFTSSSASEES
ncbi:glycosyltransferase family 2 protein [Melittangium boletus]|uniref:Glycosyl transferase family 2 n=1 Tax=Melittangium boletus DSM 14713 TaxID=1294270 RepID=A0A250IB62_9BACT|nr:glycosyltransferase family 2 protein [Melittangium boletus]ATB28450.1 glycosyl transferase family 2 [Melittangium boletus DSM 14713]